MPGPDREVTAAKARADRLMEAAVAGRIGTAAFVLAALDRLCALHNAALRREREAQK